MGMAVFMKTVKEAQARLAAEGEESKVGSAPAWRPSSLVHQQRGRLQLRPMPPWGPLFLLLRPLLLFHEEAVKEIP